jgi:hypothetical protein
VTGKPAQPVVKIPKLRVLAALLFFGPVSPLAGFLPLTAHRPPLTLLAQIPQDTLPDSLKVDEDTIYTTEDFLKQQRQVNVRVPVLPLLAVDGPRPPLTRVVFDRDSIEWGHAVTVGDLLLEVPGVFLWRGGYVGRPEPVNYQGRGSASVEYFLDGIPYVAAGVDSVGVDPALFTISFLDRIEVERWPGQLRVHLFTRRHDRVAPRSRIAVARGDNDFARYEAELERRYVNGPGFVLAADYMDSPTATGRSSSYSNTYVWAQGSYIPSSHFGAQYQLVRSGPHRRPFVTDADGIADTLGPGFDAKRTDAHLRVSFQGGNGSQGLGPRLDLIYARTAWDGAGLDQQINQVGGYLNYRAPTFAVGGSAFHRTRWTPLDVRAHLAWNPITPFSVRAELVHLRHFGGRNSNYAELAAGLEPFRGLALTGTARLGEVVAAPAILSDTAQEIRDFHAGLGWNRGRFGFELAYAKTSAFEPPAYAEFPRVPSLAPSPETEWLTASARIAPLGWLAFEAWYSDPRDTSVDGMPPTHSIGSATIRSKFLRQFPSGIFDLKLRLSVESWGNGTLGRDSTGTPIPIKGATFIRGLVQLQLDRFSIYWDRVNITGTELTYVPGFQIPAFESIFGVRWEFLN